ncbi:MAG: redoxin domain-containing protein [Bacteroidota bacterium]
MTSIFAQAQTKASDFTAQTIDGKNFSLSSLRGKKIYLSFYRNGACALCNLRVHELSQRQADFDNAGIVVIAVFESSVEDMAPFVGKQKLAFTLLSDPEGKIYQQYGIQSSQELVSRVMSSGSANARVAEASAAGFQLVKQEGSNFFRIPAEVLIDEDFNIVKLHHADQLTNHLPIKEVLRFGK